MIIIFLLLGLFCYILWFKTWHNFSLAPELPLIILGKYLSTYLDYNQIIIIIINIKFFVSGVLHIYSSIFLQCVRILFFKFLKFIFRERRWEGERERNINVWLLLAHPYWGPGPQPRHVPWLGIEPVTLCFTGWHSIHWATPARALDSILF